MDRIEAFWQDFLRDTGRGTDTPRKDCFRFGLTPEDADGLLSLVLSGRKRATTSSLWTFRGAALPRPGDLSVVTDGAGEPRCVIETTAVSVLRFSEMDWATCRREGEDETLESWRAGHRRFFEAEGASVGYRFSEALPVVFEDFRVVHDPARRGGALLLPPDAAAVMARLRASGYEAWAVGGWVRDALRGEAPHDVDIATNAPPETVRHIFSSRRVLDTGVRHGTVSVEAGGAFLEITTYRAEGPYSDGRRPDSVRFVGSLREDLGRRDFTVNAMAWDGQSLEDPFGGASDLQERLIRCVGEADARFSEDALRILRALRFASVLGFSVEKGTRTALFRHAPSLRAVSQERTAAELTGLLCGKNVRSVLLEYVAVLGAVLPEILPLVGFGQHNPHHIYDAWEHTAAAVAAAPAEPALRLAALLHDIGKPAVFSPDESGTGHFYGHAEVSERMADDILRRLRFPAALRGRVRLLVRYHGAGPDASPKSVRRWLSRLGPRDFFALLALRRADCAAQPPRLEARFQYCDAVEAIARAELGKNVCLSVADLAVGGNDLIALGCPPGPMVGRVLRRLLEAVLDEITPNEPPALRAAARELLRAETGGGAAFPD